MTTDVIYKKLEPHDLNPEKRSWYYDDFGNRLDKKTGAPVVITGPLDNGRTQEEDAAVKLLNEHYLKGPSYE